MSEADREAQILDTIVPNLEADGYTVYLQPSAHLLPSFMQGYVPDAIALGSPKNLAIQIVSERAGSKAKLEQVRKRFEVPRDWELRVYYVRPTSAQDTVEAVPRVAIEDSLHEIENLISGGKTQPALLMAWATLEALGRALLPGKFARPQSPGRLVEVLASEGHVTPNEAGVLRRLADGRNGLIHGNLEVSVDPADLSQFIAALKALRDLLPAPP